MKFKITLLMLLLSLNSLVFSMNEFSAESDEEM